MNATTSKSRVDVLAIGAHPDDIELGCGGTVAWLASKGYRVGLLHLTAGEAGTRGSGEIRRQEAAAAAEILGATEIRFLDCGDGALRHTKTEEDAVIRVLRELRPELILGPAPADRHPDHGRAHRLVADACFYAGLSGRPADSDLATHRPAANFSYMQHDAFEPAFVVDVTDVWELKGKALDAYRSQIHSASNSPASPASLSLPSRAGATSTEEPITKVATAEFRWAMEGRARHFGNMIGASFGEPFWSRGPLAVADPMSLLPGGVR